MVLWITLFTIASIAAILGERSNEQTFKKGVVNGCVKVLTVQQKIIGSALADHPTDGRLDRLTVDYNLADPAQCQALIDNQTK